MEHETQRDLELLWLTGRLAPDFKTIANFRKDNGTSIRSGCRQFVMLCRRLDLFSDAIVAIDGSQFKAVNNRDRNYTSAKMQRRMAMLEENIAHYHAQRVSTVVSVAGSTSTSWTQCRNDWIADPR